MTFKNLKIQLNSIFMMFLGLRLIGVESAQLQIICFFWLIWNGTITGFMKKYKWKVQLPIISLFHKLKVTYLFSQSKRVNILKLFVIFLQILHPLFCLITTLWRVTYFENNTVGSLCWNSLRRMKIFQKKIGKGSRSINLIKLICFMIITTEISSIMCS